MADIDKIAEIVCPICMYGCDCLIRSKRDKPECPTVTNLVALIAADRAGLEARIKAKDEALKEVRNYVVEQILEIISTGPGTTLPLNNAIAKIDKALKEGE